MSASVLPSIRENPNNLYMLARLNAITPVSGCTVMKLVVYRCPGLHHPDPITSTKLRKCIATVCQILDMKDNELQTLVIHLGHDVKTHKE